MSDEAAQIALHRNEFSGMVGSLGALGLAKSGYRLGLDIGGGYGSHGPWLADICDHAIISDLIDYFDVWNGALRQRLVEKYARHDIPFASHKLSFHRADAQDLIYRDGLFDLVVSFNAFEHIPDPLKAFEEVIRVTRPGAVVVLHFDPIWRSPDGHHQSHLCIPPWQHLLEDDETFCQTIRKHGGGDRDVRAYMTAMNRWSYQSFMDMLTGPLTSQFSMTHIQRWVTKAEDEPRSTHPNYARLRDLGFSEEELVVRGLRFFGVRADEPPPPPEVQPASPEAAQTATTSLFRRVGRRVKRMIKSGRP